MRMDHSRKRSTPICEHFAEINQIGFRKMANNPLVHIPNQFRANF
jgi:hypothetical protein